MTEGGDYIQDEICKALDSGPRSFAEIIQKTGADPHQIRSALLHLIEADKVNCILIPDVTLYAKREVRAA